jgi:hypothetical protein
MSGAIHPLPQYDFMAWTGRTFLNFVYFTNRDEQASSEFDMIPS